MGAGDPRQASLPTTPDESPAAGNVPRDAVAEARAQLLRFADQFGATAAGLKGRTTSTLGLAGLNLCLYGWVLFYATDLTWWIGGPLLAVVAVPGVLVLLVYLAFDSAAGLPQALRDMGGTLDDIAARFVRDRHEQDLVVREDAGAFRRLRGAFSALRYLLSVALQVAGAADIVSSIVFIANPVFPLVLLAGFAGTWALAGLGALLFVLL